MDLTGLWIKHFGTTLPSQTGDICLAAHDSLGLAPSTGMLSSLCAGVLSL